MNLYSASLCAIASHTSVLLSVNYSSARHQLTLQDHGYGLVYHVVCLFIPQPLLVLTAPTHGGTARLSQLGWLVLQQDGLPALR